jgi:DNA-binding NarL/FixJ family response regulator
MHALRAPAHPANGRIPVVVAARHDATRSALVALLGADEHVRVVASVDDLAAALRAAQRLGSSVVVADGRVLDARGLSRLLVLGAPVPGVRFILVGMEDHPGFAERARRSGAAAYVRLDEAAERLVDAVRESASAAAHDGV